MEKVKNVLLTGGKAALNSAVELGCSVVQRRGAGLQRGAAVHPPGQYHLGVRVR